MSSVDFNLNAEARSDMGKGASRRLRREGKVPAVIYGVDKDAVSITLEHDKLIHQLEHEAFYSHILTMNVDGGSESVVLKDLQRHPSKPVILHADFMRVDPNAKIRMHVPIHFTNEDVAPGVKAGGLVNHSMVETEISCLPKDLPEYLVADLANLEAGATLHLSDLALPAGVEIVALTHGEDHDLPVATIHVRGGGAEADEAEEGAGEE